MLLRFDGQPEVDDEVGQYWVVIQLGNNQHLKGSLSVCREIFCTVSHRCNALLLHRGVVGRNMLVGNGLILLVKYKDFSRKRNGNSGINFLSIR